MGVGQIPTTVVDTTSDEDVRYQKPVSKFTRWYRSPLFNVIIVGLISFTQPGIWNALNSLFPCTRDISLELNCA
jgi:hypothetical protein